MNKIFSSLGLILAIFGLIVSVNALGLLTTPTTKTNNVAIGVTFTKANSNNVGLTVINHPQNYNKMFFGKTASVSAGVLTKPKGFIHRDNVKIELLMNPKPKPKAGFIHTIVSN